MKTKHGYRKTLNLQLFFRMVLDDHRAIAEPVKLFGVATRSPVSNISLRVEQFRGSFDPRADLLYFVYFSFPAGTQPGNHSILTSEY